MPQYVTQFVLREIAAEHVIGRHASTEARVPFVGDWGVEDPGGGPGHQLLSSSCRALTFRKLSRLGDRFLPVLELHALAIRHRRLEYNPRDVLRVRTVSHVPHEVLTPGAVPDENQGIVFSLPHRDGVEEGVDLLDILLEG